MGLTFSDYFMQVNGNTYNHKIWNPEKTKIFYYEKWKKNHYELYQDCPLLEFCCDLSKLSDTSLTVSFALYSIKKEILSYISDSKVANNSFMGMSYIRTNNPWD